MDLDFVSIHKHAKKNLANIQPSWPHTWSITHTYRTLAWPGQGVCLPQCVEPPTRDDFWPGYKAVTFIHSCFSSLDDTSFLHPSSSPCPVRFVSLGILFSLFVVFVPSPLLGSTHFIEQLLFLINSREFEWLNLLWAFALSHFNPSGIVRFYSSAQ